MGDSPLMFAFTFAPMLVTVGIAVLFIVLAVRLVRAVEKIADRLG